LVSLRSVWATFVYDILVETNALTWTSKGKKTISCKYIYIYIQQNYTLEIIILEYRQKYILWQSAEVQNTIIKILMANRWSERW